jgi:hypothetical protein
LLRDYQIAECIEVPPGSIQVETPYGMRDVRCAVKTVPLPRWTIKTCDFTLTAARSHAVALLPSVFSKMEDVIPGDRVVTRHGLQTVAESYAEPGNPEPLYDFQVDDGRVYYTGGILSHNSTAIAARQLINAHILPKYRSLYVVPHSEHRSTYASRLNEMANAFRFPVTGSKHRQNLFLKEYPNGSYIELIKVLTSADPSRGKSSQELLWDECQNMDPSLEPEVQQTQKAASLPVTLYTGTSLTIDTMLESKYQMSSKATWHVRSPDEKHWIDMGDREMVLKTLSPEGPVCPFSGRPLDVRQGQFVHEFPSLAAAGLVGLHIPQIIIPDYAHNLLKWDEIYQSYIDYPEAKFLQEIMGIPTEEADREISQADLERLCVLDHLPEEKAIEKVKRGAYKFVVSGCDWGGSDYNPALKTKLSYTVHAILGVRNDGIMEALHFRRYSNMDYRGIVSDIVDMHTKFGGYAIASDFGVGAAYNMLIREDPRINAARHIIFGYVGPKSAPVSTPSGDHLLNQLSLNRTEAISYLFRTIKDVRPRILFGPWDKNQKYLQDMLNMYRVLSESAQTGAQTFVYRRHGSKADDTLHAVNFAFVLGRLLLGERLVEDPALAKMIQAQFRGQAASSRGRPVGVMSG